jgi:PhzF family phenazine biosynthesis protein
MELTLYQIDAFTDKVFKGNPAAVCPLDSWLTDTELQAIAEENNLSETAFYVPVEEGFHLRWFTPKAEVDLCGHATLASAFVIFNYSDYAADTVIFETRSGELAVTKSNDLLVMDFPSQPAKPCATPQLLVEGIGKEPIEVLSSEDYMAVFENEEDVTGYIECELKGSRVFLSGKAVKYMEGKIKL